MPPRCFGCACEIYCGPGGYTTVVAIPFEVRCDRDDPGSRYDRIRSFAFPLAGAKPCACRISYPGGEAPTGKTYGRLLESSDTQSKVRPNDPPAVGPVG